MSNPQAKFLTRQFLFMLLGIKSYWCHNVSIYCWVISQGGEGSNSKQKQFQQTLSKQNLYLPWPKSCHTTSFAESSKVIHVKINMIMQSSIHFKSSLMTILVLQGVYLLIFLLKWLHLQSLAFLITRWWR